jgi:hypothetical protein
VWWDDIAKQKVPIVRALLKEKYKVTENIAKTNGNGETKLPVSESKPPPVPFKIERSLMGVANSYMEIAERVVNGTLGANEAKAATGALNGVPNMLKTQLEAIKMFEKGSEKAREHVAKILDLGTPDSKALESPAKG